MTWKFQEKVIMFSFWLLLQNYFSIGLFDQTNDRKNILKSYEKHQLQFDILAGSF